MKQIIRHHFFIAVLVYLFIISMAIIPAVGFFQKVRTANEGYKEKMSFYQDLRIKEKKFLSNTQVIRCSGNLFFQADAPVIAIHIKDDQLYLSQANNKLTVTNLLTSEPSVTFSAPVLTDFYSDITDIYGTDFFNDKIIRLTTKEDKNIVEDVYPKVGRASAITRDSKGYFYVSGYVSGNVSNILGRDGFLFLSDIDKIVDLELVRGDLIAARYGTKPTLVSINLVNKNQAVIEREKNISSLTSDGETLWAIYDQAGQSQIGEVTNKGLVNKQALNCPFPLKIAVGKDKFFYSSLNDSEGKVYWINKNLQKNGK